MLARDLTVVLSERVPILVDIYLILGCDFTSHPADRVPNFGIQLGAVVKPTLFASSRRADRSRGV